MIFDGAPQFGLGIAEPWLFKHRVARNSGSYQFAVTCRGTHGIGRGFFLRFTSGEGLAGLINSLLRRFGGSLFAFHVILRYSI